MILFYYFEINELLYEDKSISKEKLELPVAFAH